MFLAIIISLAVGAVGGFVGCFFVLRNNPKLLKLDKISKDKLQDLAEKISEQLKRI
jgi:uncharacterized protein YneF (UPF0154 family)